MDQQVFRKLHPREYLERFLVNDVRPDGRSPSSPRKLSITTGSIGTAVGSAMLKLGQTTALAGVHATLVEPVPGMPDQGFLDVAVELLAMAATTYKQGRTSDEAICLTEYLRSLVAPHVDLTKLCVEEGVLVWRLRLTVYCLDNDGNLDDAILLAGVAAVRNVLLPSVRMIDDDDDCDNDNDKDDEEMNGDGGAGRVEEGKDEGKGQSDSIIAVATAERTTSLEVETFPIPVSFALFEGKVLIDPSAEEERVSEARITFLFRSTGELRGVLKPGGKNLPEKLYMDCMSQAKDRIPALLEKLNAT